LVNWLKRKYSLDYWILREVDVLPTGAEMMIRDRRLPYRQEKARLAACGWTTRANDDCSEVDLKQLLIEDASVYGLYDNY
jgi:hypothetical protein